MHFHSRLVGAFDALFLTLSALVTAALLMALLDPLAASERLAFESTHAVTDEAQALRL